MSYERKLELAFNELETSHIWKWNYNPPLHQWARKAGFQLRPPFYVPFWRNLCVRFAEFFVFFFPLALHKSMFRRPIYFLNLWWQVHFTL